MHYTTNKIPDKMEKNTIGKKNHIENMTGTNFKHQPTKIKKNTSKKNMKLGNKLDYLIIIFFLKISSLSYAEDRIISSPLINLDEIKPSFEDTDEKNEKNVILKDLKKKEKRSTSRTSSHAVLIGLDKITAKSSEIIINLDEVKKFGPLEIKILRCGKVKSNNKFNDVAYMQVKDLTKMKMTRYLYLMDGHFLQILISRPFDHAIYDLQLVNCFNA